MRLPLSRVFDHRSSAKNSASHRYSCFCYLFVAVCVVSVLIAGLSLRIVNQLTFVNRDLYHYGQDETHFLSLNSSKDRCGIWMAPSSLRPFPGYGIFTTRDIEANHPILHAPDAVSIPLRDMRRRNHHLPLYEERSRLWRNVFANYVWAHGMPDHSRYDHPPDTVDFQPGFGSLPNHHCILQSLGQAPARIAPYNDGLLASNATGNRKSPGMGAFSYHLGRDFYATRNLKAGEEIFLNYGYCRRENPVIQDESSQDDIDWQENFIYPDDIKEAARILTLYKPFGSKLWPVGNTTEALIKVINEELSSSSSSLNERPKYSDPKFVHAILSRVEKPEDRQSLYAIVDRIKAESSETLTKMMDHSLVSKNDSFETLVTKKLWFELANLSLERREPTWIKDNGLCLEHLVPKKSTLPHAGIGGFAQYGVRKGEIVVPAPVLHVANKGTLTLYRQDISKDEEDNNYDALKVGTSLLMNYCFGHSSSSVLLCPMTSAMLINHCSTRTKKCLAKGPNAEVRWSSGWDPASHEWRNKTVDDIDQHVGRMLSLEIVALRDIAPDEEVFIDYGFEWEQAWINHIREWEPPDEIRDFVSATEANLRTGPILDDLISNDLRKSVRHPYLFTGCQYYAWPDVENVGNYTRRWKNKWKQLSDREILEKFSVPGDKYLYHGTNGYVDHKEYSHWPCSVLFAEKEEGRYTVRIHMSPLRDVEPSDTSWNRNELPRILTNYSQDSIHYFVNPSATDQTLPKAFRHYIGLTHSLFPEEWKNLYSDAVQ